jgi:hypothetical protein
LHGSTVLFLKPLASNALQKLLNCLYFFAHVGQTKQIAEFVNMQNAQ